MADSLMRRVKRLVAGSVTNLVETVENAAPETVLREAVREVESAIGQVRDELGRTLASQHRVRSRLANAEAKHEELGEQIQLAIQEEREDLAKAAIARQLDLEAQTPILEETLRESAKEVTELENYLAALSARKREMEEELDDFLKPPRDDEPSTTPHSARNDAEQTAARAENAFHRVLRTHAADPGVATGEPASEAQLAELEKLARDHRIEERLTALKAHRKGDA